MKIKRIKTALLISLLCIAVSLVGIGCMHEEDAQNSSTPILSSESTSSNPDEFSSSAQESVNSDEEVDSAQSSFEESTSSSAEESSSEEVSSSSDVMESSSSVTESSEAESPESPESSESPELPHIHEYQLEVEGVPDCEIAGINRFVCACGAFYREQTPALGHLPVVDSAIPSTCVKQGLSEGSHCARCEQTLIPQEPLPLVSHRYEFGYCKVCNLVGLEFTVNTTECYATCTNYTSLLGTARRVVIPDTYYGYPVRVLAPSLFEGCKDLYSVEIGENVEIIGESAFQNCYHLVEIYDRSKAQVTKYDKIRNGGLTSYAESDDIHYEPFESKIEIMDDFVVFHDEGESILLTYLGTDKNLVIPEGVTYLDLYCLWEYEIVEVTIPTSVTFIEKWAFFLCYKLERVYFLDPNHWEAKGHDHSLCEEGKIEVYEENMKEWTPFAPGHLDTPEEGKRAIMDLYNAAYWRKTE